MKTESVQTPCCLRCGNELDDEELDYPRKDEDGDAICDECFHEHYEFTCCWCCEYGDVKDQHNLLVVFEEVSDVKPGIYKITERPYYICAMIGSSWLIPGSLVRIAELNPDMDGNNYPCGHLCLECQKKVLAQCIGKCSVCGTVCAKCRHAHRGTWKGVTT